MSGLRLVVFDCDGTLVDSQAPITLSMRNAFSDLGLPYPGDKAVKQVVGLSLADAALRLLPSDAQSYGPALVEGYRRAFSGLREKDQVHEPLYPGVREVLERLESENVIMGIATGKSRKGLSKTLDFHGISDFFLTQQTADFHPGKPNPSMLLKALEESGADRRTSLFVGDTTFDIEMGKSAGIRTLGVSWGYHEPELLTKKGAFEILRGMDEVVHHALRLEAL